MIVAEIYGNRKSSGAYTCRFLWPDANFKLHVYDDMMACGRCGGLRGLDPSPGWGHCVVFLGKTLYYYSGSLYPGADKLNAGGSPAKD